LAWPETEEKTARLFIKEPGCFAKNRIFGYSLALLGEWDGMDFIKNSIIYFVTKKMEIIKKI